MMIEIRNSAKKRLAIRNRHALSVQLTVALKRAVQLIIRHFHISDGNCFLHLFTMYFMLIWILITIVLIITAFFVIKSIISKNEEKKVISDDIQIKVPITSEQATNGAQLDIELSHKRICEACKGSNHFKCINCHGTKLVEQPFNLKVKIPLGISDGQRLRIKEQGNFNLKNNKSGDLYIEVSIKATLINTTTSHFPKNQEPSPVIRKLKAVDVLPNVKTIKEKKEFNWLKLHQNINPTNNSEIQTKLTQLIREDREYIIIDKFIYFTEQNPNHEILQVLEEIEESVLSYKEITHRLGNR